MQDQTFPEPIEIDMRVYRKVTIDGCTFGSNFGLSEGALIEKLSAWRDDTAARDPSVTGIDYKDDER